MTMAGAIAILPKARGMYAKRLSTADYEELMRRRTVPELAALLKRHPYFGGSLATLSTTNPHREQIEELLGMDIFEKYAALVHYEADRGSFSGYYLRECENQQVLQALHMLGIGLTGAYMSQIPAYLVGKTGIDLFALGQARSFGEVLELVRPAPYYRALRARFLADPALRDFPAVETALLRCHYELLFAQIDENLQGRERDSVRALFLQEVEMYNVELLLRVKAYFPTVYTTADLLALLLPYCWHIPGPRMARLAAATSVDALFTLLRATPAFTYTGPPTPEGLAIENDKLQYRCARHILRLTSSPHTALAAFLCLAKLERDNIVNVVEGVRYGLAPEIIRGILCN